MGNAFAKMVAAAGLALALSAAQAAGQVPDPFARQLARQLSRAEAVVGERGFALAAGPLPGVAAQGQSRSFTVTLRAGGEYAIVGVCDERCSNLDLRLTDNVNSVMSEDAFTDDAPVIGVRPAQTGAYTVEATVRRCAASSCYFAVNVYQR